MQASSKLLDVACAAHTMRLCIACGHDYILYASAKIPGSFALLACKLPLAIIMV